MKRGMEKDTVKGSLGELMGDYVTEKRTDKQTDR